MLLNVQIQPSRHSFRYFFFTSDIADLIVEDATAPKDRKCVRSMSVSDYVNAFKADRFLRSPVPIDPRVFA